jgi:hypothetical protein
MADWTDGARAAGVTDADIAQLQADYAALADAEARFRWLAAMNTATAGSWASRLVAVRAGWTASISAPGGDTPLILDQALPPTIATANVTATADNQPSGPLVRYTTTAATGVDAGILTAAGPIRAQWLPSLYARIMTDPSAVTGTRLWVGMTSAELAALAADPTSQSVAAFRYDSGLDVGAYWRTVTCDGAAATVTATSVAVVADSSYELRVEVNSAGTAIRFWANSDLIATHTTHLPAATTDLGCTARLRTLSASARALRFGRLAWSQR